MKIMCVSLPKKTKMNKNQSTNEWNKINTNEYKKKKMTKTTLDETKSNEKVRK